MFSVVNQKFGKLKSFKIINRKTNERVEFIPECGANIIELKLKAKKSRSILDCYKNSKELIEHELSKSWKLIPFPNRIRDGKYSFRGNQYQLPINFPSQHHAIHGFVHDKKFKIVKKTRTSVDMEYKYDGKLQGYPFPFSVKMKYVLNEEGFYCKTVIKNSGKTDMPVGDGWHPYFTFGCKVNNLNLKLPPSRKIVVDGKQIPTGKLMKYDKYKKFRRIGDEKFDTGFKLSRKESETLITNDEFTIKIWQKNYSYLQVFIPPKRDSIAIEPMTCMANAFNNKQGLIVLKPGKSFNGRYGITFG